MVLQFSSSALKTLDDVNRESLFRTLRNEMKKQGAPIFANLDRFKHNWKDCDNLYLYHSVYFYSRNWEKFDPIETEICDDDEKAKEYLDTATMIWNYAIYVASFPLYFEHGNLLKRINEVLDELAADQDSSSTAAQWHKRICIELDTYCDQLASRFETYSTYPISELHNELKPNSWQSEPYTSEPSRDVEKEHKRQLDKLIAYLKDKRITDEVAKFILNPTLGSSGMALVAPVTFPLLANVLPSSYTKNHRDDIWNARFADDDDGVTDPSSVDDSVQKRMETHFTPSIKNMSMSDLKDKRTATTMPDLGNPSGPQGSQTPHDFGMHDASREASGSGPHRRGSSSPSNGGHTRRPSSAPPSGSAPPNPPPPPPPPANPGVPDDDWYTPDHRLMYHAKHIIDAFAKVPLAEMKHDHMTRFGTTFENAVQMQDRQVKKGTDYKLMFGTNIHTMQRYVVTFTRKSRKPIFNPVIGKNW